MVLHGELLIKLLDAVQDNLIYLKLVFDLDKHHTVLGDEETCEKLRQELERLVDFQLNLLILDGYKNWKFEAHRLRVFTRIFSRLRNSEPDFSRWGGLLGTDIIITSDIDDRTIESPGAARLRPSIAATQVKSLLALAESCSKENALLGPPPPDMKALRRKLQALTASIELKEKQNGANFANDKKREGHNLANRSVLEIQDDTPISRVGYNFPWTASRIAAQCLRHDYVCAIVLEEVSGEITGATTWNLQRPHSGRRQGSYATDSYIDLTYGRHAGGMSLAMSQIYPHEE
ncbi:hypothetical protein F4824DRAFT_497511 [Ustulina deusta]|nr:hypothetical protein F4824DRAFT_497511 [Ustulina deusta]